MNRLLEILLGLDRGFLSREGALSVDWHPNWWSPQGWFWSQLINNATWNLLLIVAAVALVIWVYRREGKSRGWRIGLAAGRLAVLLLLIGLLNRPTLTLTKARVEPSVLAVMVDDSVSMRVPDVEAAGGRRETRLDAAAKLLGNDDAKLLRDLGKVHQLRFFRFDRDATPLDAGATGFAETVAKLEPDGQSTEVAAAVRSALQSLQGQNLAGVVLLTDGKDAPARPDASALTALKQSGVKLFPVAVGGTQEPRNVEVQSVVAQDTAFAGDIVNVVASVRAAGYGGPHPVTVRLKDKAGNVVTNPDGRPVEATAEVGGDAPATVELPLETVTPGTLDLVVEADPDPNEIEQSDNRRPLQIDVVEAKIKVLYVDGYPRWDYRYLKNQLVRDSTIDSSILLTSADPSFRQEGNSPIQRFPISLDELLDYDVVFFGDVSPQQFSGGQLQILQEFVGDKGGGFGMEAGPRFSPWAWRGTPVEQLLPVEAVAEPSLATTGGGTIAEGFRPVLTDAGRQSGLFRFEPTREANDSFLRDAIQPLFWYATGILPKPGVGEVFAQHPSASGPDGRPAPLVVAGRYGAGRTVFDAMDETWRWRYYTGENVFDTFWVQQLRFLARGRKLGQRRLTLAVNRPTYELGEQVGVELRVLDPQLSPQLPDRLNVEVKAEDGSAVATVPLVRRGGGAEADRFTGTFPAGKIGNFSVVLPPVTADDKTLTAPVSVRVPQLELDRPTVDLAALQRLAGDTGGKLFDLSDAAAGLPETIKSAERRIPVVTDRPLWDAPLALVLLALLVTMEWVGRKAAGLI